MRPWVVWAWRTAAILLLAASAVDAYRTLRDPRAGWWYLVNADTLNIPGFYQNVVLDGYTWRAYRPSAATFAFPDGLLYFAVRPLADRNSTAIVAWEALFFLLLLGSVVVLARAVLPGHGRGLLLPILGCLVAAFIGYCSLTQFNRPPVELALPVYHPGTLICALLAMAITVKIGTCTSRGAVLGWAGVLFALAALAAFSDRLFAVYFAAPATAAAVAQRVAFGSRGSCWHRGRFAVWVLATAAGCGAGVLAIKAVWAGEDEFARYWSGIIWTGLGERVAMLAFAAFEQAGSGDLLVLSAILWYPLALVRVIQAVRTRETPHGVAISFYYLASLLMLAGVVVAFLFSGASVEVAVKQIEWRGYSRYFLGPFGIAYFGWAILVCDWLAFARPGRGWLPLLPAGLAVGLVGASAWEPKTVWHDPLDYYPNYVRAADETCARLGVRHGMAGYWQAREITLLSRRGVIVSPIAANETSRFGLSSHLWLSNAEEVWQPPQGWVGDYRFEFVLATSHRTVQNCQYSNDIVARLGEPATRMPAEVFEVLVYNRPRDAVFQHFADLDLDVQFAKYRLDPAAPRRFHAVAYRTGRGSQVEGFSIAAPEQFDGPAALASGPYLVPRLTGRHRVQFRLTAPAGAVVDVAFVEPVARQVTPVTARPVPPGTEGTIDVDFEITEPMRKGMLEFRVIRTAPGPLVFHWVEFEKLP